MKSTACLILHLLLVDLCRSTHANSHLYLAQVDFDMQVKVQVQDVAVSARWREILARLRSVKNVVF